MQDRNNHIYLLEPTDGDLCFIGDVHGCNLQLQLALKLMTPRDTLLIGGDLIDRGPDSMGVINTLTRARNRENGYPQILAVKGNHDWNAINTIRSLTANVLAKEDGDRPPSESDLCNIQFHSEMGGEWLIALFNDEYAKKKIFVRDKKVFFQSDSKILKALTLFKSLPYIIVGKGKDPFRLVHADLPVNKFVLDDMLQKNQSLSEDKISYATLSREHDDEIKMTTKNKIGTDPICFGGHDINWHRNDNGEENSAVRFDSNHVNLDSGCFHTGGLLFLNLTRKTVRLIGPVKPEFETILTKKGRAIAEHLKAQPMLQQLAIITDKIRQHHYRLMTGNVQGYAASSGVIMNCIKHHLAKGTLTLPLYLDILQFMEKELADKLTPSSGVLFLFGARDAATVKFNKELYDEVLAQINRLKMKPPQPAAPGRRVAAP